MSQNVVDLVDFGILSESRLEIFKVCMFQNGIYLFDLGLCPRRSQCFFIYISQNLVDFVFDSQRRLDIFIYVCLKMWLTWLTLCFIVREGL